MVERKIETIIIITIILLMSLIIWAFTLDAAWFEYENMTIGNCKLSVSSFLEIPKSDFLIYGADNSNFSQLTMIFDVSEGRARDCYYASPQFYNPCIMKNHDSGWDVYFSKYMDKSSIYFGKLHINVDGTFGDEISFPGTHDSGINVKAVGVSSRNEVWFAAEKIYRLNLPDEEWSTFDYPAGWDSDFTVNKIFLTENDKGLFIFSTGNTTKKKEGVFFEFENSSISSVIQNDKLSTPTDIKEWKGHGNQYLFLSSQLLWNYDSLSQSLDLLVEGFKSPAYTIMQSEEGKYIYLIKSGDWSAYTNFCVIDTDSKTFEERSFPLDEGWAFYNSPTLPYHDIKNNKIIDLVWDSTPFAPLVHKLISIDLNDFVMEYTGLVLNNLKSINYNHEKSRIIAFGNDASYIATIDTKTGEIKTSIPLSFRANSWSVMHNSDGPSIVGNGDGKEFIRLSSLGRREIYKTGSKVLDLLQYMDGKRAFVIEDGGVNDGKIVYNFKEYFFDDGSSKDIQLPYHLYPLDNRYTHHSENMIIQIDDEIDEVIQFIKPHGKIRVWNSVSENLETQANLLDSDNEALWMIYQDRVTKEWVFYKISTQTYVELDSFTFPADALSAILNIAIDPLQRYLYLINDVVSTKIRELVIVNIKTRNITKRLEVQKNVAHDYSTRSFPCLIPIPEKNRLFLKDYYGSFCINTENMEMLYGSETDNPKSRFMTKMNPTQGFWDAERELAVVVDLTYGPNEADDLPRIFKMDIDTGTALESIAIPDYSYDVFSKIFFPKDKNKICLLNPSRSKIYTLYLDPPWDSPATISPSTNYIQLGSGDNAKFTINVINPYDFEQKATAYIWLFAPDGTMLFFSPTGLTFDISGIPLTLPANLDITADILTFTMPAGVPEGFYNFNAVFINENGDRGPISTWNFYVKD